MPLIDEEKFDIACSPLSHEIFVGQFKEDARRPGSRIWVKKKQVTDHAIHAVAKYMSRFLTPGHDYTLVFDIDGKEYELSIVCNDDEEIYKAPSDRQETATHA